MREQRGIGMLDKLAGKTVLITGASRGIGEAAIKALQLQGALPIAHASAESEASRTASSATGLEFIYQDLAQPGAGDRLVAAAIQRAGHLDGVVNNAGIFDATPLSGGEAWARGWTRTMAVNVQAPADICRAVIEHFRECGRGGQIINIASRAAHRGDDIDHAAYAASKGALISMTKTWARALSSEGIRLYSIAPGWVKTRMAPVDGPEHDAAVAGIPLGQMAETEELAALICFLLSDACPSAVGSTFDVNGASYVR